MGLAGTRIDTAAKAFMAWFGPKGVATMTFALLVLARADISAGERIFNLAALAVFRSILLHGLTDTLGANWIAERETDEPRARFAPAAAAEDRRPGSSPRAGQAELFRVYGAGVPVDVLTQVQIARARAEVAAYASDPDNATSWYRNIKAVEWKSARPARVGSRIAFVAQFLGRRLAYTYEIEELVAGERLVMRTAVGPFPMETTYTWEDATGGGTLMTVRNRGEPAGFSRLASPVMAGSMRRANRRDLERLRGILEARGASRS